MTTNVLGSLRVGSTGSEPLLEMQKTWAWILPKDSQKCFRNKCIFHYLQSLISLSLFTEFNLMNYHYGTWMGLILMPNVANSRVMILQKESNCCIHSIDRPRRSFFIRIFEYLYERCAGYNLRYCPIRGFRNKNCANEALRDIVLLLCFLMANLIVFLTIFARMTLHLSAVLVQSVFWLRRSLLKKIVKNNDTLEKLSIATKQSHNFAPPRKIF